MSTQLRARRCTAMAPTLAAMLSLVLSACAGHSPGAASSSAATAQSDAPAESSVAPKTVSDLPAGVYRSKLTVATLRKLGVDDPSTAGIWTFSVHAGGAYEVACAAVDDSGVDCGNLDSSSPSIVEVGQLRGTSPTWFVFDLDRLVKLTGCIPHSQAPDGCGGEGAGYHLNWKPTPQGLEFTDFVGTGNYADLSPLNSWTLQPWTRIS
jgi:hypothetical protein